MFNQIIKELGVFKNEIDSRKSAEIKAIEAIQATFKASAANEQIEAEEQAYKRVADSLRAAFGMIVNSEIDSIEEFITAESNRIDVANVREVNTLLTVGIDYTDRERDSLMGQFDGCYLSHKVFCKHFNLVFAPVEHQLDVLEKVRGDMLYLATAYDGELSIENVTASGAAMLRLFNPQTFLDYIAEFDADSPFTDSSAVDAHFAVLTDDEATAINELFRDCNLSEDYRERAANLELIPGMSEKLAKSEYARYTAAGDTKNSIDGFMSSIPSERTYLQRGFAKNLVALGYGEAVKASKVGNLLAD